MGRQAERLLARYPDLNERELQTLIEIFPKLPILDVGLMTSNPELAARIEAFRTDHRDKLKAPASALIVFVASCVLVPAAIAAVMVWWF